MASHVNSARPARLRHSPALLSLRIVPLGARQSNRVSSIPISASSSNYENNKPLFHSLARQLRAYTMADVDPYAGLNFDIDYLLKWDSKDSSAYHAYTIILSHVFIEFPTNEKKTDWGEAAHETLITEICCEAINRRLPPPMRRCTLINRWCFTPEAWRSPTIQKLFANCREQYGWSKYELSPIEQVHLKVELKWDIDLDSIFWDPVDSKMAEA